MSRHSGLFALLLVLQASLTWGALPNEIVVTRPIAKSPATDLGDVDLQVRYDEMWQVFETTVAKTSDDLTNTMEDLKKEAQDDANLDLALYWHEQLESFKNTGSTKWERAGNNKKAWSRRFKQAPFPDDYATALTRIEREYSDACSTLYWKYDDLVETTTRQGLLDTAKQLKSEGEAVLNRKPMQRPNSEEEQATPDRAPRPLSERLQGEWTHPSSEFLYFFLPDGSIHEDWKKTGATNDTGRLTITRPDVGEVEFADGRTVHVRMASDDVLALLIWDPSGNPVPGVVLERQKPKKPPDEASMFGGHHYVLVAGKVSWDEAKNTCWKMGGYLVTIGSLEENRFVFKLTEGQPCWIGLFSCGHRGFGSAWAGDGSLGSFKKWRPGQDQKRRQLRETCACIAWDGTDEWYCFNRDGSETGGGFDFVCEWNEDSPPANRESRRYVDSLLTKGH